MLHNARADVVEIDDRAFFIILIRHVQEELREEAPSCDGGLIVLGIF